MSEGDEKPDLAFTSTEALVEELIRRSKVFFLVARPIVPEEYEFRTHWGTDGKRTDDTEEVDRILGLVERGVWQIRLRLEEEDEPEDD